MKWFLFYDAVNNKNFLLGFNRKRELYFENEFGTLQCLEPEKLLAQIYLEVQKGQVVDIGKL